MSYSSTILADSPVAYYQLNETSGTVAHDSSGNGHDGTLNGTITLNQTAISSGLVPCMLFDGSSGYISLPNAVQLAPPFSVEMWFKASTPAGNAMLYSDAIAAYEFGWDVGDGNVLYLGNVNHTLLSSNTFTSNAVYYICVSQASDFTFTAYLAQVGVDSSPVSWGSGNPGGPPSYSGTTEIGRRSNNLLYWPGYISEVAVYGAALTGTQMNTHYTAGLSSAKTRTIPASAVLASLGLTRTIPASAVLQSTLTRTIPASAVLKGTQTRTIPSSAVLSLAATTLAHPAVMPVISRGVPAYTNDDTSGSFPASHANNSTYGDFWRCAATPAANANSGALTTPVYLAYDLSGVSSAQRGACVLAWYNDPATGAYDYTIQGSNPNNIASDYTIDANVAAGGSLPGSGWVNLATVTGNVYHSRQHAIDLTGYNWVRIRVTAIQGSASNNNCALNMDIHDASKGNQDNWIFFGDSICLQAFIHSDTTIPAQINAVRSKYFPLMEAGGIGGATSANGVSGIATWLTNFSGTYVGLLYGTNDANNAAAGDLNFGPTYITNMETMINAVIDAGKVPVIPRSICWGGTTNLLANVPVINAALAQLATTFPSCIVGPDLYTYFQANQSLISASDHIHPTLPDGYLAYQTLWVNSLLASVYSQGSPFVQHTHRAFGRIQ